MKTMIIRGIEMNNNNAVISKQHILSVHYSAIVIFLP